MLLNQIKALGLASKPDSQLIEKTVAEYWDRYRTYEYRPDQNKKTYAIDTPPPTISGTLHVGHGLSFTQIDFDARFRRMIGKNVMFPMGYDDNGLPTEKFMEKKRNIRIGDVSREDFTRTCLEETERAIGDYSGVWKALGFSIDWTRTYSTIDKLCRRIGQKSFLELYEKNLVERRKEPAIYCPSCSTTIAEAEIDERAIETEFVYLDFGIGDKKIAIATTRPELLPGCVALAVNPKDQRYSHLIGKKANVPGFNYDVEIIGTERIATEFGTGAMMICTFGDKNDVDLWREHNLPLKEVFDDHGKSIIKDYEGLTIADMRKEMIQKLQEGGFIRKIDSLSHSERLHDRCDTNIEYLVKPQWFIKILDNKNTWLDAADKIEWFPAYMKERYIQWVENLKWDWCISRQRKFGVPFPVWYDNNGKVILPDKKMLPVDPMESLPPGYKKGSLIPETDIMDTWMTSSMTPLINARWKESNETMGFYPSSVRPQAHDIIRTWLFYSVIKGIYHTGEVPFKKVMISGHGHDKYGKKMSKSKGNVITPESIIEKYSADAFRLWAANAALGKDVRFKEQEVAEQRGLINKLWNATKFLGMHMKEGPENYNHEQEIMDRWILHYLNQTAKETKDAFMQYNFHGALEGTKRFFKNFLCDNYLESIKHRLYSEEDSQSKIAARKTLKEAVLGSMKLLAPFMPNTTEYLYLSLFAAKEGDSIHLSSWPAYAEESNDLEAKKKGDVAIEAISALRKWKTQNNLNMGTPISDVIIGAPEPGIVEEISDIVTNTLKVSRMKVENAETICVLNASI